MPKNKGLGRGLDALLSDWQSSPDAVAGEVSLIDINHIRPNPHQPRTHMDPDTLAELANSIQQKGILQPVLVRQNEDHFELIAGERRWRASIQAGLSKIPAIIRSAPDSELLEMALVENIQRQDLNPIEQAQAYLHLQEQHNLTQEDLAKRLGKNRATVANTLRLNNLPDGVKTALVHDRISMGHARALLALPTADAMAELCRRVIERKLSVRETEKAVAAALRDKPRPTKSQDVSDQGYFNDLSTLLTRTLGMRVRIDHRGKSGVLTIHYNSSEELETLLQRFQVG
ncbi:MAG: ParB/RepB/Spo0J family partition protein [Deltaproteobacteria bacterium]|nr:ParB/RepB/Spo0J family partition protein [Deltaproteobacteria bacterium]